MMKKQYLLLIVAGLGAIPLLLVPIPELDAAIPPTSAFAKINVMTEPWFGSNTNVNATSSSELIYFVSDGSITFNVTTTEP